MSDIDYEPSMRFDPPLTTDKAIAFTRWLAAEGCDWSEITECRSSIEPPRGEKCVQCRVKWNPQCEVCTVIPWNEWCDQCRAKHLCGIPPK